MKTVEIYSSDTASGGETIELRTPMAERIGAALDEVGCDVRYRDTFNAFLRLVFAEANGATPESAEPVGYVYPEDAPLLIERPAHPFVIRLWSEPTGNAKFPVYLRPTPAASDGGQLEREVRHWLDNLPGAIRVREGGGPENLAQSFAVNIAASRVSASDGGLREADLYRFLKQNPKKVPQFDPNTRKWTVAGYSRDSYVGFKSFDAATRAAFGATPPTEQAKPREGGQ